MLSHVALIPTFCSHFTEKLEMEDRVLTEKLEMKDRLLAKKTGVVRQIAGGKLEMKDKALAELRSEFDLKQQTYKKETHNL